MSVAVNRSPIDRDGARKADLAAIHIAKKDLGWDEGTYRDVLFTVCRVKSSAELDFAGRKRFLDHLRRCGWTRDKAKPVKQPLTAAQRKMWSLWQQLADAGQTENRTMGALNAYVKRQTGVERIEWLAGRQDALVIESLKAWLDRVVAG